MRGVAVRLVTAAFVVGSAALGFVPLAAAAGSTTVTPSEEAWYVPNPTCPSPLGCLSPDTLPVAPPVPLPDLPAVSAYPAGSLHVSVSAGQETARSYLRFPFEQLEGRTVSAATLTVPLDVAPADGSAVPDMSEVVACETGNGRVGPSEGSINPPPEVDCTTPVALKYVATPAPHLQADLTAILADLPGITGLVLLPDAKLTTQSDAWHVTFSAHTRTDAAKTAPASITLTTEDAPDQAEEPVAAPEGEAPTGSAAAPAVTVPLSGTGFAAPPVQAPVTDVVAPTVDELAAPVTAAPVLSSPRLVTVGYAYPGVWLLPLAFLVVVPAVARALTKDLSGGAVLDR